LCLSIYFHNLWLPACLSLTNDTTVCSPGGYFAHQGYDISQALEIIPRLKHLLETFRKLGFTIYHTREGHRSDLSTLSSREKRRSKINESGLGIGDKGPLGRLLVRGEVGHDIIDELTPLLNEQIIDKPGRSAFQHTDFGLMLNIKGIKNLVICGVTTDVCVHSTMREVCRGVALSTRSFVVFETHERN
jgi:nicotinamidase-related amidase